MKYQLMINKNVITRSNNLDVMKQLVSFIMQKKNKRIYYIELSINTCIIFSWFKELWPLDCAGYSLKELPSHLNNYKRIYW